MASGSALKTYHSTLTATTVETVTLTAWYRYVAVVNKSTSDFIYATTDGSTPTVEGADTYCVRPGETKVLFNEGTEIEPALGVAAGVTVKLISSGTPKYGVEKA